MGRKSKILATARERLAGLNQMTLPPNSGLATIKQAYEAEITGYSNDEDSYNGDSLALAAKQNALNTRELGLRDWNSRILSLVEGQFGSDSTEYELVGGTRKSERKKRARKGSGDGGTSDGGETPPAKP
jgi:hypothetical protein